MKCDVKAFAQMYEAVYRDLYKFALCMMRNPHDAEDAVSEAVISAYEHIEGLKKEDAFKSWIFTILSNTCKKKLGRNVDMVLLDTEKAAVSRDLDESLDIKKAFTVLTEEEQTIVGLSVFGGYQSKEIGDMLRLNPNTVRSKRSRALEKMSCVLE